MERVRNILVIEWGLSGLINILRPVWCSDKDEIIGVFTNDRDDLICILTYILPCGVAIWLVADFKDYIW